jgi:hypothetical protein
MDVESISRLADNYFLNSNVTKLTPENKANNQSLSKSSLDLSKIKTDTLDLSIEALEKLAAEKAAYYRESELVTRPTSYGRFNEGGDYSTSVPVNFHHTSFDFGTGAPVSVDDFVQKGIINQDYVNQFNTILKDSNGNLKSGDTVFVAALNKYAELKNSISASNSPDAETQIEQLENSLNWSVGTSLNSFAKDMTVINVVAYKANSAKNIEDVKIGWTFLNGGNGDDLFTVNNSFYKTATNIVFSAVKLIDKGIDYINNNQYDPKNLADASKLLAAMNNGTDDADSSNLSLSTLTGVISTLRGFITAPDQVVLSNADKLAANAPSSDIGEVYSSIKKRLELIFSLEGR